MLLIKVVATVILRNQHVLTFIIRDGVISLDAVEDAVKE